MKTGFNGQATVGGLKDAFYGVAEVMPIGFDPTGRAVAAQTYLSGAQLAIAPQDPEVANCAELSM